MTREGAASRSCAGAVVGCAAEGLWGECRPPGLDKSFWHAKIHFVAARDQISTNIQDYAKAVYALESRAGSAVSTNALAQRLGVTAGSVSGMVRKLADEGLLEHEPYRGVKLTAEGRRVALEVLRHHRLIELFLVEVLGMGWDRVHEEAEVLEHVISEELEQLIAARLGDPSIDPHGDPIPSVEFEIEERETVSLDELGIGASGRFVRVSDSNPAMLRYLAEHGITLGQRLEVVERQPFGGPVFVRVGELQLPLGGQLAKAMRIELDPRGSTSAAGAAGGGAAR